MKILIIEDTAKHQNDARKYFQEIHPEVEVVFVDRCNEALWALEKNFSQRREGQALDGVISDIFFPYSKLEARHNNPDEPCGVAVMVYCKEKGLPCVLNTDGYHHGPRYQWILTLQETVQWPAMVDTGFSNRDGDSKDWDLAFRRLKAIMDGKTGLRPEEQTVG